MYKKEINPDMIVSIEIQDKVLCKNVEYHIKHENTRQTRLSKWWHGLDTDAQRETGWYSTHILNTKERYSLEDYMSIDGKLYSKPNIEIFMVDGTSWTIKGRDIESLEKEFDKLFPGERIKLVDVPRTI